MFRVRWWLLAAAAMAVGLLPGPRAAGVEGPPPPSPPPPQPQWVGAADVRGKARLTWVLNPAFAKVRIYRRGPGDAPFRPIGEAVGNSFTDEGVAPGGSYGYRLRGISAAGAEGPPSMEISVRIADVRLQPPVPPVWEGHLPVEGGVGLRWQEQAGRDVVAFNVYRRELPGPDAMLVGSTRGTTFRDEGLQRGKRYAYSLSAIDSSLRETARSPELEVELAPPPAPAERAAPREWRVRRTRLVALVSEAEGEPLLRPADVVAGPVTGDFYLSDSGRGGIYVFSREGVFRHALGGAGGERASFGNLLGLGVDGQENVFAVDSRAGVVQEFVRGGRPGRRLMVPPPAPGRPTGIIDAAPGPAGVLNVVDNRADRVVILSAQGAPAAVGRSGGGMGSFSAPTFCAVGPGGLLHVADGFNARVQVLDRGGQPLRAFGVHGRGPGGLARPKGVAVAVSGEVYVADSWLNTVQVFDRDGAFVAILGDEAGRPLDLGSPNGLALGPRGTRLAIAERLASRLRIVEIIDGR